MAQPLAAPYSYFADSNGAPLAGGLVYTYAAGTTTPQATYTDSTGTVPASNPVVLDSAGRATIWMIGYYKIVVKDSLGNTIHTDDNIAAPGGTTAMPWAVASGTADAIAVTYNPVITSLTDGLQLAFRANSANATTTPTFSPNGLTAHTITQRGGSALVAGSIAANLAEYIVTYNLANTRWELLNPSSGSSFVTVKRQTFPSSGTYTPSAGMLYCEIWAIGGGGGGGGCSAVSGAAAGGGAAGSEARLLATAATIGASKPVTIGTGGTAGANTGGTGGTGGTTTVGSTLISAPGGLGGVGATSAVGTAAGAGQIATVGDVLGIGAPGGSASGNSNNANMTSGYGGSSSLGGGGIARAGNTPAAGAAGTDNTGGGGGGATAGTGTAQIGGVGGKGYVIITEWCSQ